MGFEDTVRSIYFSKLKKDYVRYEEAEHYVIASLAITPAERNLMIETSTGNQGYQRFLYSRFVKLTQATSSFVKGMVGLFYLVLCIAFVVGTQLFNHTAYIFMPSISLNFVCWTGAICSLIFGIVMIGSSFWTVRTITWLYAAMDDKMRSLC